MNWNDVAIVGIGATEFSKSSGRSELRLAVEAISDAATDAGIELHEIDGLVSYSMDNNEASAVAATLGLPELRYFPITPAGGGGACGTVLLAALAVAHGIARTVVCYRAMNERSQQRFGQPRDQGGSGIVTGAVTTGALDSSWTAPFGAATPASYMAPIARRYFHEFSATSEDLGLVPVTERDYASTNPNAWFYQRPITIEDYLNSRLISDPLRLFDCCQESDGAVAIVVTSSSRAADLRQRPIGLAAAAQGLGANHHGMGSPYRSDIVTAAETRVVGVQLWDQSGLSPADIDLAIIYDHFSIAVLMSLEALGFCGRGEAAAFVREGNIGRGGALPVNTNGGQLGEGYIHGFNGIAEAVRQLRGTAVNQVAGAERALVTAGSAVPTSGLILSAG